MIVGTLSCPTTAKQDRMQICNPLSHFYPLSHYADREDFFKSLAILLSVGFLSPNCFRDNQIEAHLLMQLWSIDGFAWTRTMIYSLGLSSHHGLVQNFKLARLTVECTDCQAQFTFPCGLVCAHTKSPKNGWAGPKRLLLRHCAHLKPRDWLKMSGGESCEANYCSIGQHKTACAKS